MKDRIPLWVRIEDAIKPKLRRFRRLESAVAPHPPAEAPKYATAIVAAHLLVNIVHGLAHRELRVGLAPFASIFISVVVLILPFDRNGTPLNSRKTTRPHSPVAFDVRIIPIRPISPFPGC